MLRSTQIILTCMLFVAGCAMAACKPVDDAKAASRPQATNDAALWQGTWRLVTATHQGQSQPMDGSWRVDGDRYAVILEGKTQEHWQFTLDPATNHVQALATSGALGSHADYVVATRNPDKVGVCCGRMKGLYEISQDRLRVTFDPIARAYPNAFDAGAGSRFTAFVFERERQ